MRRYHIFLIAAGFLAFAYYTLVFIPARASLLYGPPGVALSVSDRIEYSARLVVHGDRLTTPFMSEGMNMEFRVEPAEPIAAIADRLENQGLIISAQVFYDYLVYSGLDISLQAGDYSLNPTMSIIDIARELQDSSPEDVTFVILAGWRMEEIAASLPTSGLEISPEAFLSAAQTPPAILDFIPASSSMEGYFLPDAYILPRDSTVDQILENIARNFNQHLHADLRGAFAGHNLNIHQGVILASIVEREAVHPEEKAQIASVFINRLKANMPLGSDPTVQYALGYNSLQATWWTNPLDAGQMKTDSPYNTYLYPGLPPGPIGNPDMETIYATAFPVSSSYYYFRAKCDNSGFHVFSVTLDEHISRACP